ncbi:MAG: hypothetical protein HKN10_10535 [Myxococcales bacterium]|nr:hypothetical protein [Myxococcales bacterium]
MSESTLETNEPRLAKLRAYYEQLGIADRKHTQRTFWDHVEGTYRLLESWRCARAVCEAGVFHSIYGTERFRSFELPLDRRPELQALIGEEAEELAYLNCFMERSTFDADIQRPEPPPRIRHRTAGVEIRIAPDRFDALCCVHLADWVESVGRWKGWNERRATYDRLAQCLGGWQELGVARRLGLEGS